jgi:uncharacterized integral membrane protein (TIGR00698 family)
VTRLSQVPGADLLPGLALIIVVALCAHLASVAVPGANRLLVAIFVGFAAANFIDIPSQFEPGLSTHKLLLEVGIVLMGVRLSLAAVVETGPLLVTLAVGTIAFGIGLVENVGRFLNGGASKLTSLVAAGASVCGVSAVVAVAGSIDADEEQIAYAVGTVLLLDAITLVLYPIAGDMLTLPDRQFGIWAGLSMFSTGPVTAVGFAYSEVAGRWATLTKIIRNTLIGAVAVGYSVYWMPAADEANAAHLAAVWDTLPKFLVGFLAVVVVANVLALSDATVATVDAVRGWCFLLAFAGLGSTLSCGTCAPLAFVRPLPSARTSWLSRRSRSSSSRRCSDCRRFKHTLAQLSRVRQ